MEILNIYKLNEADQINNVFPLSWRRLGWAGVHLVEAVTEYCCRVAVNQILILGGETASKLPENLEWVSVDCWFICETFIHMKH